MGFKDRFEKAKRELLVDKSICKENRDLFKQFFEYEEYKLKRQNQLSSLDEACYKTLVGYIGRFRNVNAWFKNKPWVKLTKEDIKHVYDALEDGKIKNRSGKKFADTTSYYNKIFKSKPFRLAGKSEIAKEVIEFSVTKIDKEVRFVTEDEFRKLISVVANPVHLLLFWLQWDIGENINTLLQLTKSDFIRQQNPHTHEIEYLVNLPRAKIKRSRQSRSEPTLYPETVKYLDMVLRDTDGKSKANQPIFVFGHRQALKIMQTAVKRSGAKCQPLGDAITWKDLRSGMACHLLNKGWSSEEVNARLGHTPGSKALNAYINYFAIDRKRPKQKLYTTNLQEVQNELEEIKQREKLTAERLERQTRQNALLDKTLKHVADEVTELRDALKTFKYFHWQIRTTKRPKNYNPRYH